MNRIRSVIAESGRQFRANNTKKNELIMSQ